MWSCKFATVYARLNCYEKKQKVKSLDNGEQLFWRAVSTVRVL